MKAWRTGLSEQLHITTVSDLGAFRTLRPQWNELLSRSRFRSVFLSHAFLECFLHAWGEKSSVRILVAHDHSGPRGIAPLMLSRGTHRGMPVRLLSFIENDEVPHSGFILDGNAPAEQFTGAFLGWIASCREQWDLILLRKIPLDDPVIRSIQAYCVKNGLSCITRPSLCSPVLKIDTDWELFYSQRSQRFKKRIRHSRNKLRELGAVSIRFFERHSEVEPLMGQLFQVGERSWKERSLKAIGSTRQRRKFFFELPAALAPDAKVSICSLWLDERMIAYEYHIRSERTVFALRSEFDEDFRSHGPGSVLDFETVRHLFETGAALYHMGGSPDEYKLRWTSDLERHVDVMLFSRQPYSLLLALMESLIGSTRRAKFLGKFRSSTTFPTQ